MEIEASVEKRSFFLMDSVFFKLHDSWQLLVLVHLLRYVTESVFLTPGLAEWHTSPLASPNPGYQSRQRERQSGQTDANVSLALPAAIGCWGHQWGIDAALQHLDPSVLPQREHARQLLDWAWHWWCKLAKRAHTCTHKVTVLPHAHLPPSRGGLLCTAATDHQRWNADVHKLVLSGVPVRTDNRF